MYFKLIPSHLNEHVKPKQNLHKSRDNKDQYSERSETYNNTKYKSLILKKDMSGSSNNSDRETYIKSMFTCYQPAIYGIFLRSEMEINVISSKKSSRKRGLFIRIFSFCSTE